MTSSVNGLEFFLGNLIPVIAMVTVVNAVLVPVVEVPHEWCTVGCLHLRLTSGGCCQRSDRA